MKAKKQLVIGLTGSFGSGKSTVARAFRSGGARVIDADRIAHRLIRRNTAAYRKILRLFGKGILGPRAEIARERLAGIVFNDRALLEKLNRIVHPEVIREIKRELRDSARRMVVLDVPLLIESGLDKLTDKVVVVKISRKKQLARLLRDSAFTRPQILKRIKAQMPLRNKLRLADFVIDNNGTIKETKEQVKAIRRNLWKS